MKTVYTIGYSAYNIDDFIQVLKEYGVKCLIDVRSSPFSQFYTQYNKTELKIRLESENILYRNYVDEFGARQEDINYYHNDGYLDFNKFIQSHNFKSGIEKIQQGMKLGYVFCLMCAEADPISCHRSIMVGRGLKDNQINVMHILKNKNVEGQEGIERRLLNNYFKDRSQINIFSEVKSEEELIKDAYNLKNREIGFRKDED